MCYSAEVWEDYRKYVKNHGAVISIKDFYNLYWKRKNGEKVKIPKGMDAAFLKPETEEERQILSLILEFDAQQTTRHEQDLFKLKKRLADAERVLETKETKGALESKRIASEKISKTLGWLADLRRTEVKPRDSRIYPMSYAPVMIWEDGKRVVKPMRYQCRPDGKPSFYDQKYPGTYNARRDNLEKFWHRQFGYTHGIMVVNAFYENVEQAIDGEKKNVVLEFKPAHQEEMLVACLWSHWKGKDEPDLLSFAAITDEPPAEVAAAGHDRCIIPIKPEYIDAWLNPDPANLAALYAILDDRMRPFYEHRMAA